MGAMITSLPAPTKTSVLTVETIRHAAAVLEAADESPIYVEQWSIDTVGQTVRQLAEMKSGLTEGIDKSKNLLIENLTEPQRAEFLRDGEFTVDSNGEKYTLKENITVKADGTRLCAIAPGLPTYDQMLARKLALENAPELFHSVAIRVRGTPGLGQTANLRNQVMIDFIRAVFEHRGFRADRVQVNVDRDAQSEYRIVITVRYGHHGASTRVDEGHLAYGNYADAIRPAVEDMAHGLQHQILLEAGE